MVCLKYFETERMVSFKRYDGMASTYLYMKTYNYTSFSLYYLFYYHSYFTGYLDWYAL